MKYLIISLILLSGCAHKTVVILPPQYPTQAEIRQEASQARQEASQARQEASQARQEKALKN